MVFLRTRKTASAALFGSRRWKTKCLYMIMFGALVFEILAKDSGKKDSDMRGRRRARAYRHICCKVRLARASGPLCSMACSC
eukprot:9493775-Pyramimonas_sp.AAC.1